MARGYKDDLPDGQSEIFLRGGVDSRIGVDLVQKIELYAHARSLSEMSAILRAVEHFGQVVD